MRKIIFFTIIFSLLSVVFVSNVALAVGPDIGLKGTTDIATKSGFGAANDLTLSQTIGKYIKVALSLVGTIFLALTIFAGFLWMTASGNEEQVTKATGIIKMAVIGLAIVMSAYAITAFVVSRVGSSTDSGQNNVGGTTSGGWGNILPF